MEIQADMSSNHALALYFLLSLAMTSGCLTDRKAPEKTPEQTTVQEEEMQVLVLVDDTAGRATLEKHTAIVHSASPRLFVVRLEVATRTQLVTLPGVVAVTDGAFPAEVAGQLDETETLFAAAFAARGTPKERVGDGLAWDAPGFEPPDPTPENPPDDARQDAPGATSNLQTEGMNDEP